MKKFIRNWFHMKQPHGNYAANSKLNFLYVCVCVCVYTWYYGTQAIIGYSRTWKWFFQLNFKHSMYSGKTGILNAHGGANRKYVNKTKQNWKYISRETLAWLSPYTCMYRCFAYRSNQQSVWLFFLHALFVFVFVSLFVFFVFRCNGETCHDTAASAIFIKSYGF